MTDIETIDAELDAYIVAELADEYDPEVEPRTLADIDEADRCLWRMRRIEVEMQRTERLYQSRIAQMQERMDEVLGVMRREHEWWSRRVEMWARAHAHETKGKTVKLPSGTIQFRAGRQRIETLTKEPADTVAPDFVRERREWDKTAITKATMPGPVAQDVDAPEGYVAHYAVTAADGEILCDVVRLVPVQDSITIKAGG